MRILHVLQSKLSLPARDYGGTERIVWGLLTAQEAAGHEVRLLWGDAPDLPKNATRFDTTKSMREQIGDWPDIVHFHQPFDSQLDVPYISTEHGNAEYARSYGQNTVFLSARHATNHNAECFVYNGLDWSEYGQPHLGKPQNYFHFLGKAKWPIKNLSGAVAVSKQAGVKLHVLGGARFSLSSRGFYFHPDLHLRFNGMVGGQLKNQLVRNSSGLLFPVRWHEPFGLAVIESLYLGAPVFATPYGAIPEIITQPELGFLSSSYSELALAMQDGTKYDREACHHYAKTRFNNLTMAAAYQQCYLKVISGGVLNSKKPYAEHSWHELLPVTK
ncbi:glycosyltransferase [Rheinheimera nanhaiensis]|uniref:Glucosyltransferase Lgt1 n=1 Tax=Rheinheimera nanhaiensis E407-8 TaxID=562729 RepID=I1DUE4_9GAMM|nr:glycosyltransferase [Rheinheimera nanhaiensis]GAB57672.1 glucosyltransferase Lgt1 [Rheinheimera nanhaiensis E407-8]